MRIFRLLPGILVVAALAASAWVVVFHLDWLKPAEKPEEEEKVDTEVPVQTAKISRATLHRIVEAYGTVLPEPATEGKPAASARIASPASGIIAKALCVEGGRVKAGDLLFQLDDRVIVGEEEKSIAAQERAKTAVEFALKAFERQKKLMEQEATAARKLEETEFQLATARNELLSAEKALSASRAQKSLFRIQSPLAGTVVHVRANAGEAVDVNMVLAEVIDLDRLVVQVTVPASQTPLLKLGQAVEITAQSQGSSEDAPKRKGVLGFIGFDVDRKIDAVPIRALLPADAGMRPGQYVKVRVIVDEHLDRLVVPKESVVTDPDGKDVIALVQGNNAAHKPVKVGFADAGLVEVEGEGVKEGDIVVTTGAYGLPKQTKIRVISK
jgi:membrane fusion protein (multidrug efflux system)